MWIIVLVLCVILFGLFLWDIKSKTTGDKVKKRSWHGRHQGVQECARRVMQRTKLASRKKG